MYVGKLVESADSKEFYSFPKHPYTEALLSAVPIHNPRMRDKGRRIHLQGDVADPANPPGGCYFHPRCRYAQDICKVQEPPLHNVAHITLDDEVHTHLAACHFAEELNLRGVVAKDTAETQHTSSTTNGLLN
jgi:peptide/nickel transport system ATP-binding protein